MTEDKIKLATETAANEFNAMYAAMTEEEKSAIKKVGEWFFKHYGTAGYRNLAKLFLSRFYDNKNFKLE